MLASEGVTQGDGIEVKTGSHDNIIRDNAIINVNYPGIFVYDRLAIKVHFFVDKLFSTVTGGPNIVEGNFILNSKQNGIQITAGAIVRNNIVINSGVNGIHITGNQGTPNSGTLHSTFLSNFFVVLIHNTVYQAENVCFRADWGT